MGALTRKGQDAPLLPRLALDRPLFKEGKLIGVALRSRWLAWPLGTRRGARVLVVDDSREAALRLSSALREGGYDVARAYDGVQGLAAARSLLPDLIFLDIVMPGLSGYEVLRQLRADCATAAIKVILTGVGAQGPDWARLAGANGFLRMPCDPALMVSKAEQALAPS